MAELVTVVAMDLEITKPFPEVADIESQIAEMETFGGNPAALMARRELLLHLQNYNLLGWVDKHPEDRLGVSCMGYAPSDERRGWRKCVHGGPVEGRGMYAAALSEEQVNEEIDRMYGWHKDGVYVVTWNGLGFDFRVLYYETTSPEHRAKCRFLAQRHIDLAFLFLCHQGYMTKLDAVNKAMGFAGKTEGIDGALAPSLWAKSRFDQERVLEYVVRDAQATLELYLAALDCGILRYVTGAGKKRVCRLDRAIGGGDRLQTCFEATHNVPRPNMGWWSKGEPPSREKSYAWADVGD